MRVVVTCDFLLKYSVAQCIGLSRAGAEVALLCREHALEFGGDQRERRRALEQARAAGVEVLEIPGRLWDWRALPGLFAVRARLRRFAPHVVHAHAGADPRALALLPRVPLVLTLHDPVPHPGQPVPPPHKRWLLHGARDAWRRRAAAIIVHSDYLRAEVGPLRDGQRVCTIAHGLEVHEPLPPPAEPVIGLFGRLTPYKGLGVLAAAMPRVWERRPEARLVVHGEGESTVPLEDPRAEIHYRYLPESAVPEFFAGISLLALPYTQASQTGVGSLAAGYGIPVVVSRVGGLADLALDESYVVPAGDEQALAQALLAHVDDGIDVRRRVVSEVAGPRTWEAVGGRLLELYRELAAQA